ncbi:MAG: bifunctional metallophosphatase/5'-nucleotidase, partial [Cyclobacteriaceae bacterium]
PYAVLERKGVRIGVIGLLGQDAATALIPANIAGVEVRDPIESAQKAVDILRAEVDLIVLLTHQGKTAPMQTNDEDPSIKRDIDADIKLAGAVTGIDVLLGGHADAGTEEPVVHPQTGTVIMQTYGQGFHLGYLQLIVDVNKDKLLDHNGFLLPVNSDGLVPHKLVADKLTRYRDRFPEIYEVVGQTEARLNRQYNSESDLGNLFADILCKETGKSIGLMPSGALRKDLPSGSITREELLDAFPFNDRVVTLRITGYTLLKILEQSLSLERGLLQVSGLRVHYDLTQPVGQRVNKVKVGKKRLNLEANYDVATIEILAQGGDMYKAFLEAETSDEPGIMFSKVLENYFKQQDRIGVPARGRLIGSRD